MWTPQQTAKSRRSYSGPLVGEGDSKGDDLGHKFLCLLAGQKFTDIVVHSNWLLLVAPSENM